MDIDLFQMKFVLSFADREFLVDRLKEINSHVYCAVCGGETDISFMRRKPDQKVSEAACIPCFLQNNTTVSQDDIDRVTQIGMSRGFCN